MIDFIGDIHGYADKLEALLVKLGYSKKNNTWQHPERKTLFVGDYIDRGPSIRETLIIVRRMVDSGQAIALMGNHEYNALCFHTKVQGGGELREHSIKNILQHIKTLQKFINRQKEYEKWIDWFRTLPLFYETEHFRAVHACWDDYHIAQIKTAIDGGILTDSILRESKVRGSILYNAVDESLKGKEMTIPGGGRFKDKEGLMRKEIRIKWWENPAEKTYRSYAILPLEQLPDEPIRKVTSVNSQFYNPEERPVFFGHYWLNGKSRLLRNNVCCLDFSVALGGLLAAYRFDGEKQLDEEKFVYV